MSHVDGSCAQCDRCDAVCCRLKVVLLPQDAVPAHLTSLDEHGLRTMSRDHEGWCVAVDARRMCCSIYDTRPSACRRFVMSGPFCRAARADYEYRRARNIPLTVY